MSPNKLANLPPNPRTYFQDASLVKMQTPIYSRTLSISNQLAGQNSVITPTQSIMGAHPHNKNTLVLLNMSFALVIVNTNLGSTPIDDSRLFGTSFFATKTPID